MVDITTSTTLHSSPTIPPTTSRHPRDPLRRLQHPPNVSTASSSSQLQKHFFNSSYFSPSLPHAHIRSRDTRLTIPSTPGASPTSRRRPHELLRRRRAAAASLLLQQLQQPVLDATDASSTPRVLSFASLRVHNLPSTPGSTTSSCSIQSTQPQTTEEPQAVATRITASKST